MMILDSKEQIEWPVAKGKSSLVTTSIYMWYTTYSYPTILYQYYYLEVQNMLGKRAMTEA